MTTNPSASRPYTALLFVCASQHDTHINTAFPSRSAAHIQLNQHQRAHHLQLHSTPNQRLHIHPTPHHQHTCTPTQWAGIPSPHLPAAPHPTAQATHPHPTPQPRATTPRHRAINVPRATATSNIYTPNCAISCAKYGAMPSDIPIKSFSRLSCRS